MAKAPNDAVPGPSRPAPEGFFGLLRRQLRNSLLKMWRVRGGGFYGFGFVIYFVGAQSLSFLSDITEATDRNDVRNRNLSCRRTPADRWPRPSGRGSRPALRSPGRAASGLS